MARTDAQEIALINRRRNRFERLWMRELRRWIDNIVSDYTPGQLELNEDDVIALRQLVKGVIDSQANATIGVNLNDYKQDDDDDELRNTVLFGLAAILSPFLLARIKLVTNTFVSQTSDFMRRTNRDTEFGSPPPVYRNTLKNYLYNHRITVAVTNTTWVDEVVRYYSITTVSDPLKNSVLQMLNLIESGNINEARRLNRKIRRLVNIPLSGSQRRMIDLIATPLTQAQAIANARDDANRLGVNEKRWQTVGDSNVRPSHSAANGQVKQSDEPFDVGGFPMQYPSDMSMGAPLSEVMGCRCVTSYV